MKKLLLIVSLFILSTSITIAQNFEIQHIINDVKATYAPDKRICIYDIKVVEKGHTSILKGEISDFEIYKTLISDIKAVSPATIDSIRILPDKSYRKNYWGFVPLSAIFIRVAPSFSAEITTQALMGTPVKILERKGGWLHIQTPDGYIGWTSTDNIQRINEAERNAYNSLQKVIVSNHSAFVYQKPDIESDIITEVLMGNLLIINNNHSSGKSSFFHVSLPNGEKGYILADNVLPYNQWKNTIKMTGDDMIKLGKTFIGLPYFWGGTSSRGLDCSGFTKMVYFMHGIILPRDASQQYYCGQEIDTTNGFDNLQKGDLLFFGRKNEQDSTKPVIIHVAMYMGDKKFIHSSGQVTISSFDPPSPDYDEYNKSRFIGAKRIIGSSMKGFWSIFEHPWYNSSNQGK